MEVCYGEARRWRVLRAQKANRMKRPKDTAEEEEEDFQQLGKVDSLRMSRSMGKYPQVIYKIQKIQNHSK